MFAGCNFLGGLIVFFFLIESQGRSLEQIDTMYIEHVTPMKSNKWVAPSAAEMAAIRREAGTDETAVMQDRTVDEEAPRRTMSGDTERGADENLEKTEERNEHAERV